MQSIACYSAWQGWKPGEKMTVIEAAPVEKELERLRKVEAAARDAVEVYHSFDNARKDRVMNEARAMEVLRLTLGHVTDA